jgi:hypothetical protein
MADAWSLAKEHLAEGIADAGQHGVDSNTYGQALVWEIIALYKANGRSNADIKGEFEFTLENVGVDGIFHVVRN